MALIYTGNLVARSVRDLRSSASVTALAQNYRSLGLSPDMTFQWLEEKTFTCHDGDSFNMKEDWLNPDALRPSQLWNKRLLRHAKVLERWRVELWGDQEWDRLEIEMGDLFGMDRGSTMEKFMAHAEEPLQQSLDAYLAPRMMFLDFGWRIHQGALAQEAERLAAQQEQRQNRD